MIFSASCGGVRRPNAMSLVSWWPPIGMTLVWATAPSVKIAMSVVPPPMSTSATPSPFSSSSSTASPDASGSRTMSSTSRSQRVQHLMMFCAAAAAAVTMWTRASRRTPHMPSGSRTPSCPSILYSCGSTWTMWRSTGSAMARASSSTLPTSVGRTSLSLMATVPVELTPLMWPPAMPT